MPPANPLAILGHPYLLLALATLSWSGNHIVGRAVAGHVPPGGLSTLRWAVCALVLAVFAWPHLQRDRDALWEHRGVILFLGLIGGAVFGLLQFVALKYTTAINMGVFNSVAPALIVAASALIFGDPVRRLQLLGICVSLLGVLTIVAAGDFSRLSSMSFNVGDLLVLLNMGLWAIYSTCLRLRPAVHWLGFTFVFAVISSLGSAPLAVFEHVNGEPLLATWTTAGAVVYTGLFSSTLAFIGWNRGVELIGAARAGVFLHLIPCYAAVLSSLILGELLQLYHVAGFLLIFGGVTLAARRGA